MKEAQVVRSEEGEGKKVSSVSKWVSGQSLAPTEPPIGKYPL